MYTFGPERSWKSERNNTGVQLSVETHGPSPLTAAPSGTTRKRAATWMGQTSTYGQHSTRTRVISHGTGGKAIANRERAPRAIGQVPSHVPQNAAVYTVGGDIFAVRVRGLC